MTTIAWDGNILAADSRETSTGMGITTDKAMKLLMVDPAKHSYDGVGAVAFACAGTAGGCRILKALLEEGLTALTPVPDKVDFTAILVTEDGKGHWLYTDEDYAFVLGEPILTDSVGSGSAYARAAMKMGKDAKAAVEFAMQFDPNTGGEVQLFDYTAWTNGK